MPPASAAPPAAPAAPALAPSSVPAPGITSGPDTPNIPQEKLDSHQNEVFTEAFADLDRIAKVPEEERFSALDPAASKEAEGKVKDAPKSFKPQPKSSNQPPKPQAQQPKPQQQQSAPEPKTPKELREHYDAAKTKLVELERKHAELEKRLKKPIDDPEKKSLAEKLSANEKRMSELETELRYVAYEKSQEYKDKYQKPFEDAWMEGRSNMAALEIQEVKDGDDQVIQPRRDATAEDFDRLMQLDDRSFNKEVHKLFDSVSAASIVNDRKLVKRLLTSKTNAVETYRKEGATREAELAKAREAETTQSVTAWKSAIDEGVTKYPQYFAPDEADPDGNALLEKGMHWADRAFSDGRPLKEGDQPLNLQQLTRLRSALRNKAGGFDRMVSRYSAMKTENEALKEKLAAYEKSEPGDGEGRRTGEGNVETQEDSPDDAFVKRFGR
jgi:hypothetical protein